MGGFLLLVGIGLLCFGLWNHFKGKRVLAAPFKGTGELSKNPSTSDPKGAISTEGNVIAPATAFVSPITKTACIYYELEIERIVEKSETTSEGTKTNKSNETLLSERKGALISLDDGSGSFEIDLSKGADFDDVKEVFKKEKAGSSKLPEITFNEYTYSVPPYSGDGWTIGFKATEKIVPVSGKLFVLGKLEGSRIVKPSWRSMLASAKGREGLLGSIQKKKKVGFIGGAVSAVLAIPMMIFAPAPAPVDPNAAGLACPASLVDSRASCHASVTDKAGDTYDWTVTADSEMKITVTPARSKIALHPTIVVKNAAGQEIAQKAADDDGEPVTLTVALQKGKYTLAAMPTYGYMVKGGFKYDLEISSTKSEPVAAKNADKHVKTDARTLSELASGEARADYEGADVEVTGVVTAIEPSVDSTMVTLDSVVTARLPSNHAIKKNQKITVHGSLATTGDELEITNAELQPVAKNVAGNTNGRRKK